MQSKIEQSPDTATKQTKSSEKEQVQYPAMVSIDRISHVNETSSNQVNMYFRYFVSLSMQRYRLNIVMQINVYNTLQSTIFILISAQCS